MDDRLHEELTPQEAIEAVAASARRLFPLVTEQQARSLAATILQDLRSDNIVLARARPS